MVKTTQIDESWVREISSTDASLNCKYTFCGALEEVYDHISCYWNKATRIKHEREYNNTILPALKNHDDKAISEYTKEDFENAIELIKETGYMTKGIKRQYKESSIHNFEYLIYLVVSHSSAQGLCTNVLWGTRFSIDTLDDKKTDEEITDIFTIKKSLSIDQEKKLCKELLTDHEEDGAKVALLLMWGLGLRNAEACGINFGDIKLLENHDDCCVAWIYKTTKVGSNDLQSGGKTFNTGRIVPIPYKLKCFLEERRRLIEGILINSRILDININELPVCCDGVVCPDIQCISTRCKSNQVTAMAQDVFEKAGINSNQIALLDIELDQGNTKAILKEKEPTAYLLRRNFATQMCILGLSTAEMQYLIGHDVEDAYESRNEFVDSERIYAMHLKLKERAILNETTEKDFDYLLSEKHSIIRVSAKEPMDCINVSIISKQEGSHFVSKWYEGIEEPNNERTINILNRYHSQYSEK